MPPLSIDDIIQRLTSIKQTSLQDDKEAAKRITHTDKLVARILFVLCNQEHYQKYLEELNAGIGKKLNNPSTDNLPRPDGINGYDTIAQQRLPKPSATISSLSTSFTDALSLILLEQEQKHHVNLYRTTKTLPLFFGNVPYHIADLMIANGELWVDNDPTVTGLFHGAHMHRIQHYVITRAIDDGIITVDDLIDDQGKPFKDQPLFKQLVSPQATFTFRHPASPTVLPSPIGYRGPTYRRSYWHLTLDNHNMSATACFIEKQPGISGPTFLQVALLSPEAFRSLPYLAHATYGQFSQIVFDVAKRAGASSQTIYSAYCEWAKNGVSTNETLTQAMLNLKNELSKSTHFTECQQTPLTPIGIMHYESLAHLNRYRSEATKPFFAALDNKEYGKALRTLCTFKNHKDATEMATLYLKHKDMIGLNVNEVSASNKKAGDYAMQQENAALCELLITHGATGITVPNNNAKSKKGASASNP